MNWHALYTRGRHEKLIHSELGKRGIESFLPIRPIRRRWSDRFITLEDPLFKSYLFVRTPLERFTDVLRIKGAVRFVGFNGCPVSVPEPVIEALKVIVSTEIAADPFPYLHAGDRVVVKTGLFKGIEGFIVRKDEKKCRLVISIDALMTSLSVEVDACTVEKN